MTPPAGMQMKEERVSDKQITDFLAGVVGVVEANSFESLMLWEENQRLDRWRWEQDSMGLLETVGHLADMPVCISLYKSRINGHLLLFWHATSAVVDHRLIDKWMVETLPLSAMRDGDPRKGVNRTNAMNFSNVFPRSTTTARPATPSQPEPPHHPRSPQ